MPGAFVNTNPLMRGLGAMGAPLNLMPPGASMQPVGGSFLDALRAKVGGGAGTPIRNWLGDNRSAMMMFGAGLAGGRNWGEGIAQGLAGATQGRGEDEKRRRRMAATQAIAEAQRAGKLTPELAALISTADDPASAAFQYLTREHATNERAPTLRDFYDPETRQMVTRQLGPDGSWQDVGIAAAPASAKPPEIREVGGRLYTVTPDGQTTDITPAGSGGGHMLTPEEKAAYGLDQDPRPFWVDQQGSQPEPINPPSGMSIKTNPDGTFEFTSGAGAGSDLTTGARTAQQTQSFNAQEARARLDTVKQSFKPEYTTFAGKLENMVTDWKSYLGIGNIGPDEQKQFIDYTMWRARTANNVNQVLHDMSGAAITPQEAGRLMKALPNENDGPLAFQAKLEAVLVDIDAALTRYQARLGQIPAAGENGGVGGADLIWDGEKLVPAR